MRLKVILIFLKRKRSRVHKNEKRRKKAKRATSYMFFALRTLLNGMAKKVKLRTSVVCRRDKKRKILRRAIGELADGNDVNDFLMIHSN